MDIPNILLTAVVSLPHVTVTSSKVICGAAFCYYRT